MGIIVITLCVIAAIFAASAPFYLKIMRVSEGRIAEKHQAEVDHLKAMAERDRLEAEMLTLKLKEIRGGQQPA
ncbi:MAG: hypothetical protein ACLPYB_04370 [Desulfobaccales bacterium]